MSDIEDFCEIRRDGKTIREGATVEDIAALGPIEKTVEIRWNNRGRSVSLASPNGIWAIVVPGRNFVAVMQEMNSTTHQAELSVFNADGSQRLVIPNVQTFRGHTYKGSFGWFATRKDKPQDTFSAIFQPANSGLDYRLDINAADGQVIDVHETR